MGTERQEWFSVSQFVGNLDDGNTIGETGGAESSMSSFHPGEELRKQGVPTERAVLRLPGSGGDATVGKCER